MAGCNLCRRFHKIVMGPAIDGHEVTVTLTVTENDNSTLDLGHGEATD